MVLRGRTIQTTWTMEGEGRVVQKTTIFNNIITCIWYKCLHWGGEYKFNKILPTWFVVNYVKKTLNWLKFVHR